MLEARGLLAKVEPNTHVVPHGDRSGVVIEPYLTDQWYVNVKPLAERALKAVKDGRTRIVPEQYEKVYFQWLENIEPWCISRQLWWGHQIPVWYGPDDHVFAELSEADALAAAERHYGRKVTLRRDEDVLDTWFSSGLWPFSTLGWPDETPELKRYYPTSILVTGFDIIFFWVARMMMLGLNFMNEVPFREVYIHGLVLDKHGKKMSKSKGNVVDPLELMDEFGTDALRFTMAALTTQGGNLKLSTDRIKGYRNFGTKLWNAVRFTGLNGCVRVEGYDPRTARETLNRWALGEAERAIARGDGRHRGLSVQRRRHRRLSLRLEHFLRLVCGAVEADPRRAGRPRQGRDARHCRLPDRRDRQAAAPVHAVHHRGAVGRQRRGGAATPERARAGLVA